MFFYLVADVSPLDLPEPPPVIQNADDRREYSYGDGNGNTYLILVEAIEYIPVSRQMSSSGMYDGGKPKTVKIDTQQRARILTLIDRAIGDKSTSSRPRTKGTGKINFRTRAGKVETYILDAASVEKRAIEGLLKQLTIDPSP